MFNCSFNKPPSLRLLFSAQRPNNVSFTSTRDEIYEKLRNLDRLEQIKEIRNNIDQCQQLLAKEELSPDTKTSFKDLFSNIKDFLNRSVFWNTSIPVSKIYNWDYIRINAPEAIMASNSSDPAILPKTVCLITIDVDDLKKINTKYRSFLAGSQVINNIANALKVVFPEGGVTKFGGDEFMVLMKDTTAEEAINKAKELNCLIAKRKPIYHDKVQDESFEIPYTVSIGICTHKGRQLELDEEIGNLSVEAKINFERMCNKSVRCCSDYAKNSKYKGKQNNIVISSTQNGEIHQIVGKQLLPVNKLETLV